MPSIRSKMVCPSPHQFRHLIKLCLIAIVVIFFLYSSGYLFAVKRFYIRRYVDLYMNEEPPQAIPTPTLSSNNGNFTHSAHQDTWEINGQNKVLQADEEIESQIVNPGAKSKHPNSLDLKDPEGPVSSRLQSGLQRMAGAVPNGDDSFHSSVGYIMLYGNEDRIVDPDTDSDNWSQVNLVTGGIVSVVLLIECLYCSLYLYIIHQERFCPVLCFAVLTLLSLLFHVQQYLIVVDDPEESSVPTEFAVNQTVITSPVHPKLEHESLFYGHASRLDMESCISHMTKSGVAEVVLASIESLLAIVFTIMVRLYPDRYRNRRFFRYGFPQNGDAGQATEEEGYQMQSLNDTDANAIRMNELRSETEQSSERLASGDLENGTVLSTDEQISSNGCNTSREMSPPDSSHISDDPDDLSETLLAYRRATNQRPSASILGSHKLDTLAKMG